MKIFLPYVKLTDQKLILQYIPWAFLVIDMKKHTLNREAKVNVEVKAAP